MNFREFECISRADGARYHCFFTFLQTAVSLRHSDTIDVRFLVNGKPITVAIPHIGFVEFRRRHGEIVNDNRAARIAAQYLKECLESGGDVEDLTMPVERFLELAGQIASADDTLIAKT